MTSALTASETREIQRTSAGPPESPPDPDLGRHDEDCAGAAVTVIAAGAAQRPGETRLDLVQQNAAIFRELVPPSHGTTPTASSWSRPTRSTR